MLRNKMKVKQLGATVLSGLVGDLAIPKQTGGATLYWVGEGESITESTPTFGQIALTPKTADAYIDISRKTLVQSSLDIENLIRNDLQLTMALGLDLTALHGTGLDHQPRGIENVPGINTVAMGTNGGDPTWAKIVQFETEVATDNADAGDLAFLTNAKVCGHCKTIEKATGTAKFLWADDNTMNGYRTEVSNQVKATYSKGTHTDEDLSAIFFGNWRMQVIGQWGGLDILTDPYTLSTQGAIRTLVFQDVDIQVRQPAAFCLCNDCETS
jgi:HK97 family phage major capsid protein